MERGRVYTGGYHAERVGPAGMLSGADDPVEVGVKRVAREADGRLQEPHLRLARYAADAVPGSSLSGMKDRRRFLNQHPELGVCGAAGFALTCGRLAGLSPR